MWISEYEILTAVGKYSLSYCGKASDFQTRSGDNTIVSKLVSKLLVSKLLESLVTTGSIETTIYYWNIKCDELEIIKAKLTGGA